MYGEVDLTYTLRKFLSSSCLCLETVFHFFRPGLNKFHKLKFLSFLVSGSWKWRWKVCGKKSFSVVCVSQMIWCRHGESKPQPDCSFFWLWNCQSFLWQWTELPAWACCKTSLMSRCDRRWLTICSISSSIRCDEQRAGRVWIYVCVILCVWEYLFKTEKSWWELSSITCPGNAKWHFHQAVCAFRCLKLLTHFNSFDLL